MFDLRYHVASLAAVFVALIVGILIGVGLIAGIQIKFSRGFMRASLLLGSIMNLPGLD